MAGDEEIFWPLSSSFNRSFIFCILNYTPSVEAIPPFVILLNFIYDLISISQMKRSSRRSWVMILPALNVLFFEDPLWMAMATFFFPL